MKILKMEKSFSSKLNLNSHVSTVHEKSSSVKCDICGKCLSSKSALKGHTARVHEKQKNHRCDICESEFFSLQTLEIHTSRKHEFSVNKDEKVVEKALKSRDIWILT